MESPVKRTLSLFTAAVGRVMRSRGGSDGAVPSAELPKSFRPSGSVYARLGRVWRLVTRAGVIVIGLCVFISAELLLAHWINLMHGRYITLLLGMIGCLAVVFFRPAFAFLVWMVTTPIAALLFRFDLGAGLPDVTVDRVMIISMAMILSLRALMNRTKPRKLVPGEWLIIGFVIYVSLMLPFDPNLSRSIVVNFFTQATLMFITLYFVCRALMDSRDRIIWTLVGLVVVGAYSAVMGIYDHYTGTMSIAALAGENARLIWKGSEGGRAAGPFLEPMILGELMAVSTFAAFYLSVHTSKMSARILYYFCMVIMIAAWYFTYTRGSYLPMLILLFFMPFLAGKNRKSYGILTATAVVAGMIIVPILLSDSAVYDRMTAFKQIQDRVVSGATLLSVIKSHPLFGVGLGNMEEAMKKNITSVAGVTGYSIWQQRASGGRPVFTVSHNTPLTIVAEQGLIGSFFYFGALFAFLCRIWLIRARLPDTGYLGKDFAALVMLIMVGHWVAICSYDAFRGSYMEFIFWIVVALALQCERLLDAEEETARGASSAPVRLRPAIDHTPSLP